MTLPIASPGGWRSKPSISSHAKRSRPCTALRRLVRRRRRRHSREAIATVAIEEFSRVMTTNSERGQSPALSIGRPSPSFLLCSRLWAIVRW